MEKHHAVSRRSRVSPALATSCSSFHNGFTMVSQWFHNGFTMVSQWFHNGFTMVSQWFHNGPTCLSTATLTLGQRIWSTSCRHWRLGPWECPPAAACKASNYQTSSKHLTLIHILNYNILLRDGWCYSGFMLVASLCHIALLPAHKRTRAHSHTHAHAHTHTHTRENQKLGKRHAPASTWLEPWDPRKGWERRKESNSD